MEKDVGWQRGGGVRDRETERKKLKGGKQSEQPAELGAFMMLSRFLDFVPIGLSLSAPFPHMKRGEECLDRVIKNGL